MLCGQNLQCCRPCEIFSRRCSLARHPPKVHSLTGQQLLLTALTGRRAVSSSGRLGRVDPWEREAPYLCEFQSCRKRAGCSLALLPLWASPTPSTCASQYTATGRPSTAACPARAAGPEHPRSGQSTRRHEEDPLQIRDPDQAVWKEAGQRQPLCPKSTLDLTTDFQQRRQEYLRWRAPIVFFWR